ncbi:acyltransferase family protein [Mucilaginibacter sp. UYCu711]|uniref:acyltransferase family protein n=1 Tax=Mucilaginibacter sp. UYCu711 TaxID=3156339 RepID=UPI003D191145
MPKITANKNDLGYVPDLDGLRAIAILSVMFYHFEVFSAGWIGVQLFFVLSGYLITKGLASEKKQVKQFGSYIKIFYLKRVLRIFPVYFLYVACFLAFCYITHNAATANGAAIPLITYTVNIYGLAPHTVNMAGFGYVWSLSAEEQFYLIWPFIVFFSSEAVLRRILYAIMFIAPLWRLAMLWFAVNHGVQPDTAGTMVYITTLSQFDAFAVGALIVYITDVKNISTPRLRKMVFAGIAIFLLIGQVNVFLTNRTLLKDMTTLGYRVTMLNNYQYVWGYSVINLFAGFIIFIIVKYQNVIPILSNKVLVYIGRISYGMYIFHVPVLLALDGLKHRGLALNMIRLALFFSITILLAHLSYYYFELYFLKKKKKVLENITAKQHSLS